MKFTEILDLILKNINNLVASFEKRPGVITSFMLFTILVLMLT